MGTSYREIRANQKENKDVYYNIYRKFSAPFTYLFVKLEFSPSAVSILNFFPGIMGYFLLSKGTYTSIITGLLFFILYKVWDCSDGEVARIQNKKAMDPAHKKVEGAYFDAVGHFIEPICLGSGLGVGLSNLYSSNAYITLGLSLSIIFILEFALIELVRSYFRRGIIERNIKLKKELKYSYSDLIKTMDEGRSWENQNMFFKIFGIYPFLGLIYSREFIAPVLIILTLIESTSANYLNFPILLYGFPISILGAYLFIISLAKAVKITNFISNLKNKQYITHFLNDLQKNKQ